MYYCRKNIFKVATILLVLTGFGLHLAQPLSANQHSRDFTRWLQSIAKKDQTGDIQQELQKLRSHQGNLAPLIHKASEIVLQNNDKFRLPAARKQDSPSDIYQLLLQKWNMFQTGESMQPLAFPGQDTKNANPLINSQAPLPHGKIFTSRVWKASPGNCLYLNLPNPSRVDVIPLKGGTAIGAP